MSKTNHEQSIINARRLGEHPELCWSNPHDPDYVNFLRVYTPKTNRLIEIALLIRDKFAKLKDLF